MNFSFVDPWHLFLPRDGGHVVALSGSGGKTSLLQVFAAQLVSEDVKAIFTCTTRTEALPGFPVYDLADVEASDPEHLPAHFYVRDSITKDEKWLGVEADDVDRLSSKFSDRVIVVEVDGSACLPLKFYQPEEPVWPRLTSLAVVVMGTSAVGEAAGDVVHRFDRQEFPPLKELKAHDVWQWDHSYTLLTAPGGYLEQVPADIPVVLAMTSLAQQDDSIGMFEFVGKVMENDRMPLVVFCETTGENPSFRTSCRRDEDDEHPVGTEE